MVLASVDYVKQEDACESKNDSPTRKPQQQEQDLLPLSHEQAQKRPYQPGCPVIYVNTARKYVTMSRVDAVFVDLHACAAAPSCSFVYRLQKGGLLVEESQLQYAPSCPVWAFHENSWKPSVVWNSYQEWPLSDEPRYSVQQVESGALIHGISADYIRYREDQHPGTISVNMKTPANKENVKNAVVSTAKANEPVRHMTTMLQSRANYEAALERKRSFSDDDDDDDVDMNHDHTSQQPRPNSIGSSPQAAMERKRASFVNKDDPDRSDNNVAKRIKSADANDSTGCSNLQSSQDFYQHDSLATQRGYQLQETAKIIKSSDSPSLTNHASSQDSNQRDSRATQRGYPLQETSYQRDSCATQRGYPLRETRDDPNVVTTFFFVPRMKIFSVNDIEAFHEQHADSIMNATKCTIRYCSASSKHCIKFELTGTEDQIDNACNTIEKRLVAAASQHEASLALYYLALWNQHRRNNDEVCLQYCRRKSQKKSWMYAEILSSQDRANQHAVIGRGGERKRRMERQTRCRIIFSRGGAMPYYYISGDTANDVKECKRLVGRAFDDAIMEGKRGYY